MYKLTEYGKRLYSLWNEEDPTFKEVDDRMIGFVRDYRRIWPDLTLVPGVVIYDNVGIIAAWIQ